MESNVRVRTRNGIDEAIDRIRAPMMNTAEFIIIILFRPMKSISKPVKREHIL